MEPVTFSFDDRGALYLFLDVLVDSPQCSFTMAMVVKTFSKYPDLVSLRFDYQKQVEWAYKLV